MPWEDDLNNKVPPQETETPEAKVGEPLLQWTDGCLDIHFINSGRGECAFYILPDGTTLLGADDKAGVAEIMTAANTSWRTPR